ncbi:hypothetical protein ACFV30_27245 [Streptomyces sp. NPDC059752]
MAQALSARPFEAAVAEFSGDGGGLGVGVDGFLEPPHVPQRGC